MGSQEFGSEQNRLADDMTEEHIPWEPPQAPPAEELPGRVLYAIASVIGGHGLGATSSESILAMKRAGILGGAVGFAVEDERLRGIGCRTLRWHLSRLAGVWPGRGFDQAMAERKRAVQEKAASWLRGGEFDLFHGWSGEARLPMIEARRRGVPSVLDIPTWHRDKGRRKPYYTRAERERALSGAGDGGEVTRQQVLTEYALADLILVQSQASAESFLRAGVSAEKLFLIGRGVDVGRFQVGEPPSRFRLVFSGSVCKRKGVDVILRAWKKLALRDAELVFLGAPAPDIEDDLREFASPTVRLPGFVAKPEEEMARCTAFVFPSRLEGSAKVVYEAAACGLPLISTRESGDLAREGKTGHVVEAGDVDGLASAIEHLYHHRDEARRMGLAARALVEGEYTWDHFRARLLRAYARAFQAARVDAFPGGEP